MPLQPKSEKWIGQKLFVLPHYGYGWGRPDLGGGSTSPLESLGPEPFYAKVEELILCVGEPMGITGTIDEPSHQFDKYWYACLLRNPDECDFTANPGDYMIWIAEKKLPIHPAPYPQKALAQWVVFEESKFCLCGYGVVAESVEWIKDKFNVAAKARKQAKSE
jgi:hypothetical protein